MNEGIPKQNNGLEVYDEIDMLLAVLPPELRTRWSREVEDVDPVVAVEKLREVVSARTSVVNHGSVHYSPEAEHDPVLYRGLQRIVSGLETSFGDPELYLGEGNVAEVYRVNYEPRICIKTIVNDEAYRNGNTLYQEGGLMEELNNLEVDGVRTPKLYFYHDTIKQRSLGMETIEGASLAKIVTGNADLAGLHDISVDDFHRSMQHYVEAMHDQHIFHGDLFERNIMVESDSLKGRVIDFGKSKKAYFDGEIGGYREGDFEVLKRAMQSLDKFLRGEKVDLNR